MYLPAMDAIQLLILDRPIIERDSNPNILLANNHAIHHNIFSWIAQKPGTARMIGAAAGRLVVKQIRNLIAFLITHITTPRWNNHPLIFIHRFGLFTGSITIRQTLSQSLSSRIAKITSRKLAYEVRCRHHNSNPLILKNQKFPYEQETHGAYLSEDPHLIGTHLTSNPLSPQYSAFSP